MVRIQQWLESYAANPHAARQAAVSEYEEHGEDEGEADEGEADEQDFGAADSME